MINELMLMVALGSVSADVPRLSFNGLTGGSTMADVRRTFPDVVSGRLPCRPGEEAARYANGVTRCDILKLNRFPLVGYDFEVGFFFHESGTLKTVSMSWPAITDDRETPSRVVMQNAYSAIVDLYVARYGRYVARPPCELIGSRCNEWQLDGTTSWHAGGERIRTDLELDARALSGVRITYSFADQASLDRI